MISFTLDQWYAWINALVWPVTRVLAFFIAAPVFGEGGVPVRIKVGLGILLGAAISPMAGPMPDVPPSSWEGLWILTQQVIIGLALGLCMRFALTIVQVAGDLVGLQMGLSFATFFDPSTNAQTAVLSRIFHWVALLVFLTLDCHLLLLSAIAHTFNVLPIADGQLSVGGPGALIAWSGQIFTLGLLLSLPVVTALLIMNLAMGILNRTAPQLSVFAIGFPLSLVAGLIMLTILLPQTTPFFERLFSDAFAAFERIVFGFQPT